MQARPHLLPLSLRPQHRSPLWPPRLHHQSPLQCWRHLPLVCSSTKVLHNHTTEVWSAKACGLMHATCRLILKHLHDVCLCTGQIKALPAPRPPPPLPPRPAPAAPAVVAEAPVAPATPVSAAKEERKPESAAAAVAASNSRRRTTSRAVNGSKPAGGNSSRANNVVAVTATEVRHRHILNSLTMGGDGRIPQSKGRSFRVHPA